MKIIVPFKSVCSSPPLSRSADANWEINPFDAIAIEEALRIKQRGEATEIVCVTVGPPSVEEQIRASLAMGADRATRIDDSRSLDPYAVSRILKAFVLREAPQLVIMGKQAIDDDCNQVGQMLAGLLGWPQATFISSLEFIDDRKRVQCARETDAGLEVIAVTLPAVFTTDLRLNEPRYVSLPGLIKARRKAIEVLSLADLNVSVDAMTTVIATSSPARRPPGTRVGSVDELLVKLQNELGMFKV